MGPPLRKKAKSGHGPHAQRRVRRPRAFGAAGTGGVLQDLSTMSNSDRQGRSSSAHPIDHGTAHSDLKKIRTYGNDCNAAGSPGPAGADEARSERVGGGALEDVRALGLQDVAQDHVALELGDVVDE